MTALASTPDPRTEQVAGPPALAAAGPPSPAPTLATRGVRLGYRDRAVIDGLDLEVPTGLVTAIVGANGCGKSTLLRGLARLLPASDGAILLDGRDIREMPTKEVARRVGLLPQSPLVPDGLTVVELVTQGRHPHHGLLRRITREDEAIVAEALELTDTTDLAERCVDELSGGQRQRVWIALALAQRTDVLLLDEPTSFLDIAHQIDVLELVGELNARRGTTIVMVLHDLAMAARYSEHLVAMRDGRVVAQGHPSEIVTEALVADVFDVECRVITDPETGTPVVLPRRTTQRRGTTPAPVDPTAEEAS